MRHVLWSVWSGVTMLVLATGVSFDRGWGLGLTIALGVLAAFALVGAIVTSAVLSR